MEGTTIWAIPLQALIADTKLQNRKHLADESISQVMIYAWNDLIKICGLEIDSKILGWCAYVSEFTPNNMLIDSRFGFQKA